MAERDRTRAARAERRAARRAAREVEEWAMGKVRNAGRGMRNLIYHRDGGQCRYCGVTLYLTRNDAALAWVLPHPFPENLGPLVLVMTLDHVLPIARGGRTAIENLVAACWSCNQAKGDRTLEEAGMALRPEVVPLPVTSTGHLDGEQFRALLRERGILQDASVPAWEGRPATPEDVDRLKKPALTPREQVLAQAFQRGRRKQAAGLTRSEIRRRLYCL